MECHVAWCDIPEEHEHHEKGCCSKDTRVCQRCKLEQPANYFAPVVVGSGRSTAVERVVCGQCQDHIMAVLMFTAEDPVLEDAVDV